MVKKTISWKTKGMNRDTSVSAFNPEFSFENVNLRLSTNEGNTMMSWVNERGTKQLTLKITRGSLTDTSIRGTVIGTAVIDHKLVVFSVYESDTLYRLENGIFTSENKEERSLYSNGNCFIYIFNAPEEDTIKGDLFYQGDLLFDSKHPLETLVSYESDTIQKIYWTDGKNQPRFINIKSNKYAEKHYDSYLFDFVPELDFKTTIKVENIYGSGEFPAGVIQYAFTRCNKNGQESCIFYTTPLHYISYVNRGTKPGDKVSMSFKITIGGYTEKGSDYIRIYSILRTSKDAIPIVKRVKDVSAKDIRKEEGVAIKTIPIIDNGLLGETIDPTELLYKGGEYVVAKTLEQKDNTLFLGNIKNFSLNVKDYGASIKKYLDEIANHWDEATGSSKYDSTKNTQSKVESVLNVRKIQTTTEDPMLYVNTLTSSDGATGFKAREYYRLGLQFQYKTGKWSEPIWIGDFKETEMPTMSPNPTDNRYYDIGFPGFKFTMGNGIFHIETATTYPYKTSYVLYDTLFKELYEAGYRTIRPLFALPNIVDRTILLQGIMCPTMYRISDRYIDITEAQLGPLYAQSSWLFRAKCEKKEGNDNNGGYVYGSTGILPSQYKTDFEASTKSPYLRNTEIMGIFNNDEAFRVDYNMMSIHSPEITFDTCCNSLDFSGYDVYSVGTLQFSKTYGDIEIQTSTPPINSISPGFIHKPVVTSGNAALISGLFYSDFLVDDVDKGNTYRYWSREKYPVYFPVYMWHRKASLNNDVERNNRSAQILKKKISNYRVGYMPKYILKTQDAAALNVTDMDLFSSNELSIIKLDGKVYMGNIEKGLLPTQNSPIYISGNPKETNKDKFNAGASFSGTADYKLTLSDLEDINASNNLMQLQANEKTGLLEWKVLDTSVGDYTRGLAQNRDIVNIKYKSTPHIVVYKEGGFYSYIKKDTLCMVEICKKYNKDTFMGGTSDSVLQSHTWIPCGPVVNIEKDTTQVVLEYKWGDTYFQQYECLKTYPFSNEDINQVIEIASFMCETRVNIDGRYDRNRGMTSNLNVSPTNFNLFNPVYSQMDNFFNYKILDKSNYTNDISPNVITWTKTKENGADIDLWTNITLANTLELDGDKGNITKLSRYNDQLLTFQEKGIAQILYNENTQISTTEGVPIEIANSQKVQGKRYLSNTIGCSNKWSMVQTPTGIYFMDSNNKSIYLYNGQLINISTSGGFNSWAKQNIPASNIEWTPNEFNNFTAFYDNLNQEILFINKESALAYSEKFNCFTSFYDYGNAPYLNYIDDIGIWIKDNKLWQHQAGEYCNIFGENKSFSMTLVANQEPQLDKIFTNLEFRACVNGEGTYDDSTKKFTPSLPFDTIEVWDEYQHGISSLRNRTKITNTTKMEPVKHGTSDSLLLRKFRIWGCDIPRDNAPVNALIEVPLGIKRFKVRPLDRMRNPWIYIKLGKDAAIENSYLNKVEIHDIVASYFA